MDTVQAKASRRPGLHVYCHVPFCGSTCDFCAFYQEKPKRQELERYLKGMERQIAEDIPDGQAIETIFWGGGTPGLLPAKDIERLGTALLAKTKAAPKEWTVEMAPATVKADKLAVMRDMGVTRVSMGVQNFHPELLQSLGRLHNPKQIYQAYERIREAGFDNVNLDLMFALPGQTFEQWEADLREAFRLGPEHLSTYCLTFEEDTALYIKMSQGKVKRRSLDEEANFYERTWELLESAGYGQYEVSNFCKPVRECLHNINTWQMGEWIGLGPSAASQYAGRRYTQSASIDEWITGLESGTPKLMDEQALTQEILLSDALIFGLRLNRGVCLEALGVRFGAGALEPYEGLLKRLEGEGYLVRQGSRVALTQEGRLLADAIGEQILRE